MVDPKETIPPASRQVTTSVHQIQKKEKPVRATWAHKVRRERKIWGKAKWVNNTRVQIKAGRNQKTRFNVKTLVFKGGGNSAFFIRARYH
jgi:hypothetical protein